jgi:hypothetical protein
MGCPDEGHTEQGVRDSAGEGRKRGSIKICHPDSRNGKPITTAIFVFTLLFNYLYMLGTVP